MKVIRAIQILMMLSTLKQVQKIYDAFLIYRLKLNFLECISEKKDEKSIDKKEDEDACDSHGDVDKKSVSVDKDLNGTDDKKKSNDNDDAAEDENDEDNGKKGETKPEKIEKKAEGEEENVEEGTSLSDIQKINDNINKNRVENLQILYRVRIFKQIIYLYFFNENIYFRFVLMKRESQMWLRKI